MMGKEVPLPRRDKKHKRRWPTRRTRKMARALTEQERLASDLEEKRKYARMWLPYFRLLHLPSAELADQTSDPDETRYNYTVHRTPRCTIIFGTPEN